MIHAFLNQTTFRSLASRHKVLYNNSLYEVLEKSPVETWKLLNGTKIDHIDFPTIDSFLIPTNVCSSTHWLLTHIDLRLNTIAVYDSINCRKPQPDDPQCHIEFFLNKHPYLATKLWRIEQTPTFSQQTNRYDSGAFVWTAALAIITYNTMQFTKKATLPLTVGVPPHSGQYIGKEEEGGGEAALWGVDPKVQPLPPQDVVQRRCPGRTA